MFGISLILVRQRKIYEKSFTNCSWSHFNNNFWQKTSMQNSAYRKLLNLKFFQNLLCLYFHQILRKASRSLGNDNHHKQCWYMHKFQLLLPKISFLEGKLNNSLSVDPILRFFFNSQLPKILILKVVLQLER